MLGWLIRPPESRGPRIMLSSGPKVGTVMVIPSVDLARSVVFLVHLGSKDGVSRGEKRGSTTKTLKRGREKHSIFAFLHSLYLSEGGRMPMRTSQDSRVLFL